MYKKLTFRNLKLLNLIFISLLVLSCTENKNAEKNIESVSKSRSIKTLAKENSDHKFVNLITTKSKGANVKLNVSKSSEIVFTIKVSEVTIIEDKKNDCSRISIPNAGHTANIGFPEQLAKTVFLEIDPGVLLKNITANVLKEKYETFQNINLCAAQKPLPDLAGFDDSAAPFIKNEKAYKINDFTPKNTVALQSSKNVSLHRILPTTVFLSKYNPKTKELRIPHEVVVKINLPGAKNVNSKRTDPRWQRKPVLATINNFVLNSTLPTASEKARDNGVGYLIIAHEDFRDADSLLTLGEHKRKTKGLNVNINYYDDTFNAEEISQEIREAYNTWDPAPMYVLIVGDANKIPPHYKNDHPYGSTESPVATDIYYGITDTGDDPETYWPDLFVGRLPAKNANQLKTMVDKIIFYETDYLEQDWKNKVLLAAYFQDDNNDRVADRFFTQTSEIISDFLETTLPYPENILKVYTTNSMLPQYYYGGVESVPRELEFNGTTQDVINAINSGVFLVNHRDHGSTYGWSEPSFRTEDVQSLLNEDKLPIFLSMNCRSGRFDAPNNNSLGEELLLRGKGGAVGYIGASRISYSGYNDELDKGLINAIWPAFQPYEDNYNNETAGLNKLGAVLNAGKFFMYEKHVLSDAFGYPWSDNTEYTRVEFEEFNLLGDPELDLFFGEQGLQIISEIDIIDDCPECNNNGVMDKGETIKLIPRFAAFNNTATNVTATLSMEAYNHVTIEDGDSFFDEIPEGTQVINESNPFIIKLSDSCGGGHEFSMNLNITADEGYDKTRAVNMEVYKNAYEHKWNLVNLEGGEKGCGVGDLKYGIMNAGEEYRLDVSLWTTHAAHNVQATLVPSDYSSGTPSFECIEIINGATQEVGNMDPYILDEIYYTIKVPEECAKDQYVLNFRLNVSEDDYENNVNLEVQPIFVTHYNNKWPFVFSESDGNRSRIADLDPQTPGLEIVYNNGGSLRAIRGDTEEYWNRLSSASFGMAISDINLDGNLEIVTNYFGYEYYDGVKAISHDGSEMLFSHSMDINYYESAYPSVADIIPSSSGLETIIGRGNDELDQDAVVTCLSSDGELLWHSDVLDPDNNSNTQDYISGESCSVADVNRDGLLDVICTATVETANEKISGLYVLNNEGRIIAKIDGLIGHIEKPPVIANLDLSNDELEIVLPVINYGRNNSFIKAYKWNDNLENKLEEYWTINYHSMFPITIADVDDESDGPEILFTASSYIHKYASDGTRIKLLNFSQYGYTSSTYNPPILVADVDEDPELEILVSSQKGVLILSNNLIEKRFIGYDLPRGTYVVTVGDIIGGDRAGKMEILLGNFVYDFLDLVLLEDNYVDYKIEWSQFHGNLQHTGCYGSYDEGCPCSDNDRDGYLDVACGGNDCNDNDPAVNTIEYDNDNDGYSNCQGDCNDGNPNSYPGATEICDRIDNDCDGVVPNSELDLDGDGYSECLGDCNDNNVSVYPRALEICDGLDNDCDGTIDPSEADLDGDKFRVCESDCDDSNPFSFPGARELCDGEDNDCDDRVPENETDNDNDGYMICENDCNDNDANISPGAIEGCDGIDSNCNGLAVEGEFDLDEDGYMVCEGDCNDQNTNINPAATEICDDVDNNCDGETNENIEPISTTCGVGDCFSTGQKTCIDGVMTDSCLPGFATEETCDYLDNDCDGETDEEIESISISCGIGECVSTGQKTCVAGNMIDSCEPGIPVKEICDGLDNDCDGEIPENEADNDNDGYMICQGDCDDENIDINLDAAEICYDEIDNNCNGEIDEDCQKQIEKECIDNDDDEYGENCDLGSDCNDKNVNINPGVSEICDNEMDDNCDEKIDCDDDTCADDEACPDETDQVVSEATVTDEEINKSGGCGFIKATPKSNSIIFIILNLLAMLALIRFRSRFINK